ncbi:MAG: DEAD/DEAH box helicase [Clostridia bacterium]|nr:DEAD/DEAH box helicase [Clostridia bacterium]
MSTTLRAASGSSAENLFISLFEDVFGAEKTGYLYSQYPFFDIYQDSRFADFLLENGGRRVAIEIDDDASHLPGHVSQVKHYDDLTKQNSMIHMGWAVYRWPVRIMQEQPERVKDELRIFLGSQPQFRAIADYLPTQRGRTFQLKEHQQEALDALAKMREAKETIALIHHATGTGKTVTAVSDAKRMGGRTLYIAHTKDLITQAADTFRELWPEVSLGLYVENHKETDAQVICASVQSVALNLDSFLPDAFDYLIIDEAHHAAAETYQKVLAYFTPRFTLGLTATPERADDQDILEIFKNTAHRLDIQTAVEIGELVPVRCIRIHTNIDLTKVRFNSVQYNIRDLESKIFVPERNQLIVDTWLEFVRDKRTVIFCASITHAEQIAALLNERGVPALAVSGSMKLAERNEATQRFAQKKLLVLCACDLLNEGWDCPETEVLFMARPTMSKVLYTQQLGRGMRLADGKDSLMVFDFVDNASQYNMPYSLHRLFRLKDYHAGGLVAAPMAQKTAEESLYAKGERPDALVDYPVDATDYELVDLFNWQEEATGMLSQMEFVRRVDVQSETVERYVREGMILPDLVVPMSEHRTFKYFKEEMLEAAAAKYGWTLIDDSNRKAMFMDMVRRMDMSYSYKPVLMLAVLACADGKGRMKLSDLVHFFRSFYADRRSWGLVVEKSNSLYCREDVTDKEIERNILANPFKRFEDMQMMRHTKTLGIVEVDNSVWKWLTEEEKTEIRGICEEKLEGYYCRLG